MHAVMSSGIPANKNNDKDNSENVLYAAETRLPNPLCTYQERRRVHVIS